MKNTAFCPISNKRIDEHVARLNGALTTILLLVFILTGSLLPILFLIVDFAFRSGEYSRFSLLAYVSRKLTKILNLKPLLINAGPKVFAARIGLFFSIAIAVSLLFDLNILALALTGVFGICAFLESAFGYCVACQVYPLVYKLTFQTKF